MNPKTGLYTVFALALLFVPLFHTESMDSITGRVTSYSNNQPSYFGKYTMPADYETGIDTDFAVYEDLRLKAANLIPDVLDCENSQELDHCVSTRMDRAWSTDCGDEEEHVFFQLADDFEACALSEDDYCLCSLSLEPDAAFGQGQVGMTVVNTSAGTLISSDEHQNIIKNIAAVADVKINGVFAGSKIGEFALAIDHDNSGAEVIVGNEKLDYDDNITLFKSGGQMIFVSKEDIGAWQQAKGYAPRKCTLNNKRIYRFCIDTGEELAGENLVYKFALDFSDNTVPVQPTVNIAPGDSHIILSWARNEPDIGRYDIYVSMSPFSDITSMEPSFSTSIDYADLSYFYNKGTRYGFINDQVYHVAVVPVDNSNNYQKTGLTIVSVMPKSLNSNDAGVVP